MKKLRIREILMGIACAVVGTILTVVCIREPAFKTGFWAVVCWLGFGEMVYIMFLAPEVGEKRLRRIQKVQEVYRERFGVFGPVMRYMPVLIIFAGLLLAVIVTKDIALRTYIILAGIVAAGAEGLWLRSWLDEAMKEFDRENQ